MSRRRYISTDISVDKAVNRLAMQAGDFAALLYTWMIPHADDDATLTGDPEEILMEVVPGRRDKSEADVEVALTAMAQAGLISWGWDQCGRPVVEFPPEAFYKRQAYIAADKRRTETAIVKKRILAEIGADWRELAENSASVSPSVTPSVTPSPSVTHMCVPPARTPVSTKGRNDYSPEFEGFWSAYPRHKEKAKAFRCWQTRRREGHSPEDMIAAAKHYAEDCRRKGTTPEYIKHASTFLGPDKPFLDYVNPPEETDDAAEFRRRVEEAERLAEQRRG